jgi:malonyl-CoA/methylmalonyl-CoA synthetase
MGVPTFYTRLLQNSALSRDTTKHMRLFISGSAPLLAETFESFRAHTGATILERYGMTETGMLVSNPLEGPRVAGTVGRPLPGVEVRIVDDDVALPPGRIGQVQVRGHNVFRGYWNLPERTRDEFTPDGWFRTGDVGEWVADGPAAGYVRLSGRAKDLIITGGLNVYPKEIEERLDRLQGVEESAVIGVPDADFGEAVVAVIVPRDGHAVSERDVLGALRGEIASFKIPKRVYVVDALPRNAMGKVQKNVLRATYSA